MPSGNPAFAPLGCLEFKEMPKTFRRNFQNYVLINAVLFWPYFKSQGFACQLIEPIIKIVIIEEGNWCEKHEKMNTMATFNVLIAPSNLFADEGINANFP
jgi:hypothetical protein